MSIGAGKDSLKTFERHDLAVRMKLQGATWARIGAELGVSKQRAQRMTVQALRSGRYSVHVQIQDARGVPLADAGDYLRRALADIGIATHKAEPNTELDAVH